jgi:hypothetical protein
MLVLYADDPDLVVATLGLVPVEPRSANAIVLRPQASALTAAPTIRHDLPLAPMEHVLADLLTLPGRSPQEAEALMDALAKTDPAWKA